MKKIVSLFTVLFFLAAILVTGCKKEESVENNSASPQVVVKDGILKFADEEAMQTTLNNLAQMTEEEADNWEKQLGFHSIQRYRTDAEKLIIDNIDKLINSGYKVDELQKKVICGKMNDIPQAAQNIIDLCGFKVRTNEDNTRELYIPVKSSVNFCLLNADYMYAIGNQIHCFKNDNELISKEWNKNFANLKSTNDYTMQNKNVRLAYTKRIEDNYNKFDATLRAQRVIYWSAAEKDTWSHVRLYIDFFAQHKEWYWFTWKPQEVTGSGSFSMQVNWRGWADSFKNYSDDMATTKSPHILFDKWSFDGDFPWFAFKDAQYTLEFANNNNIKIHLVQNPFNVAISPCYLYNVKDGVTYDRTEYSSPGNFH